jgi:hypothetical protein
VDIENLDAGTQFIHASAVDVVAHTSIGSCDNNDPMARRRQACKRPAGKNRLVVRMGVESDDGSHRSEYAFIATHQTPVPNGSVRSGPVRPQFTRTSQTSQTSLTSLFWRT